MRKKWLLTALAMLIVCSMTLATTACATKTDSPTTPVTIGDEEIPAANIDENAEETVYETYLDDIPASWNPHTWYSTTDMVLLEFLVTPFAANYRDAEGTTVFEYEAATGVTDITEEFLDKEIWNINEDATAGYVFQIDLNPLLTWEDGVPVTADTYIYSMQALLDSDMSNYRAGRYSAGAEAIRGAFNFINRAKAGQDIYTNAVEVDIDEDTIVYFNVNYPCYFFGDAMSAYFDSGWGPLFLDENGENPFEKYADSDEFLEVTDDIIDELTAFAEMFGESDPDSWLMFCHVITGVYEDADWEDVGLLKTDDYQMVLITENPMTIDGFLTLLKRNWIVREEVYEAGKTTEGDYVVTDYNLTPETTVSFGPYKLVSIEDGLITLEKNENWFGWDGEDRFYQYTYEDFGDYDTVTIEIPIIIEDQEIPGETSETTEPGEAGEVYPFPFAFETEDLYGETVTQDVLGEKEIFFCHLWATWCGPCVEEMGDLAKIAEQYGDRVGFIALLTDFDTNAKGAIKLTEYNGIPFINVFSNAPDLEELNGMLRSGYVPTTIIIDGEGNIIGEQIIGSYGTGYAKLIEEALANVRSR